MKTEVDELINKQNDMIRIPVRYEFYEDEYHDEGEGPTYTLVQLVYHPDIDKPARIQVKAGQTIDQIGKLVEGLIEGMRVFKEFVKTTIYDE